MSDHIDSPTIDDQIIEAARAGDVERLRTLLDRYPDKLHVKVPPYDASLLFPAAQSGSLDAVGLLLDRGLDVNDRERGDNTYALHWVAAQGNLAMARKLVDAGGDVIGNGDDHASVSSAGPPAGTAATTMRIARLRSFWSPAARVITSSRRWP